MIMYISANAFVAMALTGTDKEREVFKEAVRRADKLREPKPAPAPPPSKISMKIEEHSKPINGKDIDLVIRLHSPTPRDLTLHINAQVMLYNGILESSIWSEEKQVQLLSDKGEMSLPNAVLNMVSFFTQ